MITTSALPDNTLAFCLSSVPGNIYSTSYKQIMLWIYQGTSRFLFCGEELPFLWTGWNAGQIRWGYPSLDENECIFYNVRNIVWLRVSVIVNHNILTRSTRLYGLVELYTVVISQVMPFQILHCISFAPFDPTLTNN